MAIQAKQKSKSGRTSQARRVTDNEREQTAVSPGLPGSAAPNTSTAQSKVADAAESSPTDCDHQAVEIGMRKTGDDTQITIVGDTKSIMREFGTDDPDFLNGFVDHLANAGARGCLYLDEVGLNPQDMRQYPDELGIKFMLAFVKKNKPADEIMATLLGQMAATNVAIMKFANRLAHATNLAERDSAERTYNKLTRTYLLQVEALQRYRSKSDNNVIFQHISVRDRGQAIVGNVTRSARRRALKNRPRATPLIADARQTPMEMIGDRQQARVPPRRSEK
jgi:hypothetical protein